MERQSVDVIKQIVDIFLHVDDHLREVITEYGAWTYGLLFLIVFLETGIVVTPFLPGDSLIFAAATLTGPGELNPWALFFLLSIAAILGDTLNYSIGHRVGARAFTGEVKWIKKEYMERTHRFFEKHGGKTIFLARFVPIVRTFAPFVAGISRMSYAFFIRWNVIGGIAWVGIFTLLGYFFGGLEFVKKNFSLVIVAIIIISIIPIIIEAIAARRHRQTSRAETPE